MQSSKSLIGFFLIFGFIGLTSQVEFLDYTNQHLLDCDNHNYTQEQLKEILIIHQIDFWVFTILSPVGLFFSLFIIVTFIQYPQTRKSPGDIILALSIADLLLNVHFFISAMESEWKDLYYLSDEQFCQVNAFLSISLSVTQFIYNCAFCIALYDKVRYSIRHQKRNSIFMFSFHFLIIFIGASVWAIFFWLDQTGINLSGLCSFKVWEEFPYVSLLLIALYISLSVRTIYYIHKKIPKTKRFQRKRKEVQYYIVYLIFSATLWSVMAGAQFLMNLNCQTIHDPGINIVITACNLFKMMCPLLLPIIRFNDPIIQTHIKKVYRTFQNSLRKYCYCFISCCSCCLKKASSQKTKTKKTSPKKQNAVSNNNSINLEQKPKWELTSEEEQGEIKTENSQYSLNAKNAQKIKKNKDHKESQEEQQETKSISSKLLHSSSQQLPYNIKIHLLKSNELQSNIDQTIHENEVRQRHHSQFKRIEDIIAEAVSSEANSSRGNSENVNSDSAAMLQISKSSQVNGIQDLVSELKDATMKTIITSLYYQMGEFQELKARQIDVIHQDYLGETQSKSIFPAKVKEDFPNVDVSEILYMTVQTFAPQIFRSIYPYSKSEIDLQKAMSIEENHQSIELIVSSGGASVPKGQSGDFIFFTPDNRVVVKTINPAEVVTLMENLNDYALYLSDCPHSLLNQIISLFSYERSGDRDFVVLMENIIRVPSEFIINIYDLQGSTHNRETLTQKNQKDGESQNRSNSRKTNLRFSNTILKDLDFLQFQKVISISQEDLQHCKQVLQRDSAFLATCDILDYSLLVIKVNWQHILLEEGNSQYKVLHQRLMKQKQIFRSSKKGEENVYYHFSIIDYLQNWNIRKRIESTFKILCCYKDPSVQEPNSYRNRFLGNIISQIFSKN